jgi:hypothetical protein
MQLIQLLQEASSLSLPDLKKAMSKDKRAAPIFKKDLKLEDIADMDGFLTTLKYYLFNNSNVQAFMQMRGGIKDMFQGTFNELKKLKASEIDASKLEEIKDFATSLFKEHAYTERGGMSTDLKKELKAWVNGNGGYHNLSRWAQKELAALPALKPDKRIVIYRGVLFSEYALKSERDYDGVMQDGNGIKFLKSIRTGGKEIDIKWDRPSSWTTSKDVATQFAKYGPASSSYSATLQWLSRGEKKIDGALGYVISTFANPEDVLIDMRKLTASIEMQHGGEGEVILKPGEYHGRVVSKYTVEGEVDPTVEPDKGEDSEGAKASVAIGSVSGVIGLPSEVQDILKIMGETRNIWSSDALLLVKYTDLFKKLILNSTTTAVTHTHDKLVNFYKKELHHIEDKDLMADKYAANPDLSAKIPKVKQFISHFRDKVSHSKFRSDKNSKAVGQKHELTGDEYRSTLKAYDLNEIEKELMRDGYFTSSEGGRSFTKLAGALDATMPTSAAINRFSAAKQKPVIDEVIKKFFKVVGLAYDHVEPKEAEKVMINLIRKAYRNYSMLGEVNRIEEIMKELK